jgi:phenylpropionate dioxygenase-like ring-hydroxylating dioxygenase large terminal subunit
MQFLKNSWYVAAWSEEVERSPLGRTILNMPIVLFRTSNGDPVALHDVCPHRFALLSGGKIKDDAIECPYHGLQYGSSGACVLNPHGPIPGRAKVKSYPVFEKYEAIWIWTGDIEPEYPPKIPDFSLHTREVSQARYRGRTYTRGNYQLVVDNLLDASHVHWLHPQLRISGEQELVAEVYKVRRVGDTIHHDGYAKSTRPNGLFRQFWDDQPVDFYALMRWDAPSLLLLELGVDKPGMPLKSGISLNTAHLITPETETTAHYFWSTSRNMALDAETTTRLREFSQLTFSEQDSPMIELQQKTMGTSDLMSLQPLLLSTDAAAVQARRILQSMIEAEKATAAGAT